MFHNNELNSFRFDLAEQLSPTCEGTLYQQRDAAALHELLDSIKGVTVLSLHEGRLSNSENGKCLFLENPKVVFAFNSEGISYVEEFMLNVSQMATDSENNIVMRRVTFEKFPLSSSEQGNINHFDSVSVEFRMSRGANLKDKEAVRAEVEEFFDSIWGRLLDAATEADEDRGFFDKYLASPVKVAEEGEIIERSVPGRAIAVMSDNLGFEHHARVSKTSVRQAAKVLTSSKALFKLVGYMVSENNIYPGLYKIADIEPSYTEIPNQKWWQRNKKHYKQCTLLFKDVSKSEVTPDGIVTQEEYGLKQDTFVLFCYLVGTDKLLYMTFFKTMSEKEVIARFDDLDNTEATSIIDYTTSDYDDLGKAFTTEGLFSEIFMDVDAYMRDKYRS